MVVKSTCSKRPQLSWQDAFMKHLPELERRLARAFRHLGAEAREDSTADALALAMFSFRRLYLRGRSQHVSPSTLAWYAAMQIRRGCSAGCRQNAHEPLSRFAQLSRGFRVERLHATSDDEWIDRLVNDKRAPVSEQAIARLDIRSWLGTLPRRTGQLARDLAIGDSTCEAAKRYGISASRVSQLRRALENSWNEFQNGSAATKFGC